MAATVDQCRERVLKDIGKAEHDAYDICSECGQGRMRIYSVSTGRVHCDHLCTPLPSDNDQVRMVDRKMMAMGNIMHRLCSGLDEQIGIVTQAQKKALRARKTLSQAEYFFTSSFENILNLFIDSAKELLARKDEIIHRFYPQLVELRAENSKIIDMYQNSRDQLLDIQASMNAIIDKLDITRIDSNPGPQDFSLLRYNPGLFDRGVELARKASLSQDESAQILHKYSTHSLPLNFNTNPSPSVHESMATLLPILTSNKGKNFLDPSKNATSKNIYEPALRRKQSREPTANTENTIVNGIFLNCFSPAK